jgi:hypothetical protein
MMTFIHSIAEVVRMQRRRFQQVLGKHDVPPIAQLLERNNTRNLGPAGGAFRQRTLPSRKPLSYWNLSTLKISSMHAVW